MFREPSLFSSSGNWMSSMSATCYPTRQQDQAERTLDVISKFSVIYVNHIHRSPPRHPVLNHINQLYIVRPYFLKILLSYHLRPHRPIFFIRGFPVKFLYAILTLNLLLSSSLYLLPLGLYVYVSLVLRCDCFISRQWFAYLFLNDVIYLLLLNPVRAKKCHCAVCVFILSFCVSTWSTCSTCRL
jgi:hypothetical protein